MFSLLFFMDRNITYKNLGIWLYRLARLCKETVHFSSNQAAFKILLNDILTFVMIVSPTCRRKFCRHEVEFHNFCDFEICRLRLPTIFIYVSPHDIKEGGCITLLNYRQSAKSFLMLKCKYQSLISQKV